MKAKRVILMMVILVSLLGVFAHVAGAAPAYYLCTINNVGIAGQYAFINLTDTSSAPAFVNRWFVMSPNMQKQLLAVALTAQSNDFAVLIYLDLQNPIVDWLTLQK